MNLFNLRGLAPNGATHMGRDPVDAPRRRRGRGARANHLLWFGASCMRWSLLLHMRRLCLRIPTVGYGLRRLPFAGGLNEAQTLLRLTALQVLAADPNDRHHEVMHSVGLKRQVKSLIRSVDDRLQALYVPPVARIATPVHTKPGQRDVAALQHRWLRRHAPALRSDLHQLP